MKRICDAITRFMAVIVLAAAVFAFFVPEAGDYVRTSSITAMLGCIMFGMGLTLNLKAFVNVFSKPKEFLIGTAAQFIIMPSLAFALTKLFKLPPELAVGVILVGCCPGGTSSNVITYLSGGDVALSVGMTGVSTLLAPILTPLLVKFYAGATVPVDFWGMFFSILEVIIIPIALGLAFKKFLPRTSNTIIPYLPAFSTIVITLIVIAVVAANASSLHQCGLLVILVVMLHNIGGYALGFAAARICGLSRSKIKAISIEVGMQNSGLACGLAAKHFSAMAMASVPGAVFSIWHNISGAVLARLLTKYK